MSRKNTLMKIGIVTHVLRHLFVASIGIVALVGSGAKAEQFQFTMDSGAATITGSIGATLFTQATWSLSGVFDTATVVPLDGSLIYPVAPRLTIYSGSNTHVYDYGTADAITFVYTFPSGAVIVPNGLLPSYAPTGLYFIKLSESGSFTTPGTYAALYGLVGGVEDTLLYTRQGAIIVTDAENGLGTFTVSQLGPAVPEPAEWAGLAMLGTGLGGLVVRARRRKVTA